MASRVAAHGWLLACVLGLLASQAWACSNDDDCSLLGVCATLAGVPLCVCDPGWTGPDCGRADLAPYTGGGYYNRSAASWGGVPVFADGKWHLFATQLARECPLSLFINNSAVVRLVADSLEGPYEFAETVLPPMHHNPTIVGPTPDGYYLLYTIGGVLPSSAVIGCESGVPPECNSSSHVYNKEQCTGRSSRTLPPGSDVSGTTYKTAQINMAWARSVYGPWESKVVMRYNERGNASAWDIEVSNPTATILPNGTVLMVYRGNPWIGGHEALGVAVAQHWNATYQRLDDPIVSLKDGTGNHEDPFVWRDRRGHFHIVDHDQSLGNVCNDKKDQGCGSHLFSRDGVAWKRSSSPVYDEAVLMANGSTQKLQTRQRPQLVLNDDGEPLYLFNGASFEGGNSDLNHLTSTLAFAFKRQSGNRAIRVTSRQPDQFV